MVLVCVDPAYLAKNLYRVLSCDSELGVFIPMAMNIATLVFLAHTSISLE